VKKPVEILDLHLESPFVYRSELVVPDLKVYQQLSYIWDGRITKSIQFRIFIVDR
jgi:hypothetical protein